jgi:Kef-type K+ transport system membrane component KefB
MEDVFEQIALVLAICVTAGGIATLLRLPLLVGLLVAGIVVGPEVLGLVSASPEIALLGEIGIALLLFVVGLKLDPRVVRRFGSVILATGVIQVSLTGILAYGIAVALDVAPLPAAYLAAATAFSSTVVVIKLLGDRRELEQLHGRAAVGILIVQDLVVVLLMIGVTATAGGDGGDLSGQALGVFVRGAALLAGVALLARYVLPRVSDLLARRGELLVLASVTWAVAVAAVAHLLGFSAEVGAFAAGVALASSPYREAISGRLATLRDFLLVFFFIDLGTALEVEAGSGMVLALALSAFVLILKPVLIAAIATALGFRASVGVRTGLVLGQISEFSLILVALGVGVGHIDAEVAGTVTIIALVTITASTFLSAGSDRLVSTLRRPLLGLERSTPTRDLLEAAPEAPPTIIVFGVGRLGHRLATELRDGGETVLAVDYDPRHLRDSRTEFAVVYGDAEDPELVHQLPLDQVRWVISTLRDPAANGTLVAALRNEGYDGHIAVSADHDHEVDPLSDAGADLVVRPFQAATGPLLAELDAHERRRRDV